MGARKTVPPRMLRMVPLGESHTASGQYFMLYEKRKWGEEHTLLQLELLYALLIWGNGSALHSDRVFLDGLSSIYCDLIVCLISIWQAQIVVFEVDVKVWVNEFVLDILPDDAGHLIAVKLDDRILDLDLLYGARIATLGATDA